MEQWDADKWCFKACWNQQLAVGESPTRKNDALDNTYPAGVLAIQGGPVWRNKQTYGQIIVMDPMTSHRQSEFWSDVCEL